MHADTKFMLGAVLQTWKQYIVHLGSGSQFQHTQQGETWQIQLSQYTRRTDVFYEVRLERVQWVPPGNSADPHNLLFCFQGKNRLEALHALERYLHDYPAQQES